MFEPALAFYVVLSLALLCLTQHQFYASDVISYLSIAQKYGAGHWLSAVNGVWSPLPCWVLALFIKVITNQLIAFKIMQLIVGFFIVLLTLKIGKKLSFSNHIYQYIAFLTAFFVSVNAAIYQGGDVFFLVFLVLEIYYLAFGFDYLLTKKIPIIGLIGSGLYLSKYFGLAFFLVQFTSVMLVFWLQNKSISKKIVWYYAQNILVFLLVCGLWSACLTHKFGVFQTTSLSASDFFAVRNPHTNPSQSIVNIWQMMPVLPLPDEHSVSFWDDTHQLLPKTNRWQPFSTLQNFRLYLHFILKENAKAIFYLEFGKHIGSVFLVIWFVSWQFKTLKKSKYINHNFLIVAIITIFFIYLGYGLVFVGQRYFWATQWLWLLLTCWLIDDWQPKKFKETIFVVLKILIGIAFLSTPFKDVMTARRFDFSLKTILITPVICVQNSYLLYNDMHRLAQILAHTKQFEGKKIVSFNTSTDAQYYTSVERMTYIALLTKGHFLGEYSEKSIENKPLKMLKDNEIDYYFVWNSTNETNNTLTKNWQMIYENQIFDLKVFEIK